MVAGDDVLSGVLLHQVKPAGIIDRAVHLIAHLQRAVTQMQDFPVPFLYVQHPNAAQRAQITGLPAALGIKGSGVQRYQISLFRWGAASYPSLTASTPRATRRICCTSAV